MESVVIHWLVELSEVCQLFLLLFELGKLVLDLEIFSHALVEVRAFLFDLSFLAFLVKIMSLVPNICQLGPHIFPLPFFLLDLLFSEQLFFLQGSLHFLLPLPVKKISSLLLLLFQF